MKKQSFREQLNGFTLVNIPLGQASCLLEESLKRYGHVVSLQLRGIKQVVGFLSPLKSFTTRYVAMELDGWTCLLTDMTGESCYVDGYAMSRACGCNGFGVSLRQERRELNLFENGEIIREIQSVLDGDRWYYQESGDVQWFENVNDSKIRRANERLEITVLKSYLERYTGIKVPEWKKLYDNHATGLERSLTELRVKIIYYDTVTL